MDVFPSREGNNHRPPTKFKALSLSLSIHRCVHTWGERVLSSACCKPLHPRVSGKKEGRQKNAEGGEQKTGV